MKTVKDSGQLLISANTDKSADVPKGKIQITTVQYRTYEYELKEFDDQVFLIHDANLPEAKLIAQAVNKE